MGYLAYPVEQKIFAWLIAIGYLTVLTGFFIYKTITTQKELKLQRLYLRSIAIFLFFYICVRIAFIFSDIERDLHNYSNLYIHLVLIGYSFGLLAFLQLVYFGEKYLLGFQHHFLTFILSIFYVMDMILIFFPQVFLTSRILSYLGHYSTISIIFIIFLIVLIRTSKKAQQVAFLSFLGLLIAALSAFLESDFFITSGLVSPLISPLLLVIGLTIFTLPQKIMVRLIIEYYTNKKICLVHRGKIKGKIYFCQTCFVCYCQNCFENVILKEKLCWSCGNAIEAKNIEDLKLFEMEEMVTNKEKNQENKKIKI